VLAGIGLFLGAFGSNGNQAAKIIGNAIEQDINIQKANIDQKTKGVSSQRTLFNDMMDQYKDKDAAMNATRVALINNAQMKLNSIAGRYQGKEAKAKAMQLMGELEAQKNQAAMAFQGNIAKQYQLQQLGGDPTMQKIQMLPDDLRKRALDELTKAQEYGGFTNEVSKTYKNIMSTGAGGVLGSILGGDKEAYQSAKAFLSGAIVGKVPGIKSDSDFENIVVPMLPKPGETMAAATKKAALFDKFLISQKPGTPVLKSFNLEPKQDDDLVGFKPKSK
jgi:phosphopantetheinyl transferase (holo-ACP synthase)